MFRITSLQQRLAVFLLLPVALLLFAMMSAGFFYARNNLLAQWREAVVLKLGRAAHSIDMRLLRPKEWLQDVPVGLGHAFSATTCRSGSSSSSKGWMGLSGLM